MLEMAVRRSRCSASPPASAATALRAVARRRAELAAMIAARRLRRQPRPAIGEQRRRRRAEGARPPGGRALRRCPARHAPVSLVASEELDGGRWRSTPPAPLARGHRPARRLLEHRRQRLDRHASSPILPGRGGRGGRASCAPGREQLAAGFVVYGPQTALVAHPRRRRAALHARPATGAFRLAVARVAHPGRARPNTRSTPRTTGTGTSRCAPTSTIASPARDGPRGADFNMRWIASLVAEAYRILMRGGVFLYPGDARAGLRAAAACASSTRRTRSPS